MQISRNSAEPGHNLCMVGRIEFPGFPVLMHAHLPITYLDQTARRKIVDAFEHRPRIDRHEEGKELVESPAVNPALYVRMAQDRLDF